MVVGLLRRPIPILPTLKVGDLLAWRLDVVGCVSPQKEVRNAMPCPDKVSLKSYLTPEEYKGISEKAAQANLSISQYVKAIVLGYEVKR